MAYHNLRCYVHTSQGRHKRPNVSGLLKNQIKEKKTIYIGGIDLFNLNSYSKIRTNSLNNIFEVNESEQNSGNKDNASVLGQQLRLNQKLLVQIPAATCSYDFLTLFCSNTFH